MFAVAIAVGIYSYVIFTLGVLGLLNFNSVVFCSIAFMLMSIGVLYRNRSAIPQFKYTKFNKIELFILLVLVMQALVNFVGVLGPEISFDALWYHLTLPKIFLMHQKLVYIPGNLLFYSEIPKLTEMIYAGLISIGGSEVYSKILHFIFGILTLVSIYKFSIKFVTKKYALLAALIFYSNLLVGWESISVYIDLSRTFFTFLTFWAFISWAEKKELKWLIISSLMLGFSSSTKLVSIFDIFIYLPLIFYILKNYKQKMLFSSLVFIVVSLLVLAPWLVLSFIHTGNPVYPYGSLPVDGGHFLSFPNSFNLIDFNDPISPIYLISAPIILFLLKKFRIELKFAAFYMLAAFCIWFFTQEIRGTRFLLPYLPVFSIVVAYALSLYKDKLIKALLITIIIIISLSSIGYRSIANAKFVPYILGKETKIDFLKDHLNFEFGDFADVDGYFKNNIKNQDKVLLYGFHNLYYVDFPYIDSSYVSKGDKFNFVAVQNTSLPERFRKFKLVYYNGVTHVKLYTLNRKTWLY